MTTETITMTPAQWREMFPGICPIGIVFDAEFAVVGYYENAWAFRTDEMEGSMSHLTLPINTLITHALSELVKTWDYIGLDSVYASKNSGRIAFNFDIGNGLQDQLIRYCPGLAQLMGDKTYKSTQNGWEVVG